jgi:hypothetical protein
VVKGWHIVVAFVGAGYLWGFIEFAPFAHATMRTSTYLVQGFFAQPQISGSVTALGLRNGISAGSTGVGAGGSASGPAAAWHVVDGSMRAWQYKNPVDRWLPRTYLAVHDLYFRFAWNIGLRRPLPLDALRYDAARAISSLRGTSTPLPER